MQIISWQFAAFVGGVALIYYPLPRRWQNVWLLIASYGFYLTWAWQFTLVLVILTAVNLGLSHRLQSGQQRRKGFLWLGIAANILSLAVFKYANFFVPQALAAMGLPGSGDAIQIILPVGLSYLVLQMISYLVDVYRGQMPPAASAVDFALFVAFFPKLLSGPIERARAFLPKLAQDRVIDNAALARSLTLITVGLVRKVVIAGFLASAMSDLLNKPAKSGFSGLIVGLIFYGFYLYNDFAGYTGIARGVSGLLGIELLPNFNAPFFARNFTEFWNRWHISLSHWLRDYIYFPISRALLRRNPNPRWLPNLIVAPIVTMLVSGLWHGAALNLLAWGLLHGLYQAGERLATLWSRATPPDQWPRWRQAVGILGVFMLTTLAWLPFNFPNFVDRVARATNASAFLPSAINPIAIALIGFSLLMDWVQHRAQDEAGFLSWPRLAQAAALAAACLLIFMNSLEVAPRFVYQGF